LKIWKWVFFSLQAEGRGFESLNSHNKPRIFRGFFYVNKFKNSAPKINQKSVQNSEFDVFGFFELRVFRFWRGVFSS